MLIKAHRFSSVRELYEHEAPVLKTLVREPGTLRARDARPSEETLYDWINSAKAQFMSCNEKGEGIPESVRKEAARATFYNEADAAEDRILFPEEHSSQTNALFKQNMSSMTIFEKSGPDFERFVLDIDTDEELGSEDGEDWEDSCPSCKGSTDDGDDVEQSRSNSTDASADGGESLEQFNKDFSNSSAFSTLEKLMSDTAKLFKAPPPTAETIDREFMSFVDREKSKGNDSRPLQREMFSLHRLPVVSVQTQADLVAVFKESWHKADLEPGAQLKYSEALRMVKEMVTHNQFASPAGMTPFAKLLRSIPGATEHRRSVTDMFNAFAAMSLFFSSNFFESDGTEYQDTLLIKQDERAKQLPSRRRYDSNKCMPREFWEEWDSIIKTARREHSGRVDEAIPLEWNVAIRPFIAHRESCSCIGWKCPADDAH